MTLSQGSGELKRTLGLFSLIAYGVGDILGAGIYVLIGRVAGLVGSACWVPFLVALVTASLTGLSYAELGSRFPRSAGESFYSLKAFESPLLSYLVGFFVLMSGVVSMAVVSQGFTGYVRALWPTVPAWAVIGFFFLVLLTINFWGMKQSSMTNIFCTAIEVGGILLVIVAGLKFFGHVHYLEVTPPPGKPVLKSLLEAGVLAFYAFIGFEDMVKAAEESYQPSESIPRAIVWSIGIVAGLYLLTAVAAVSAVSSRELAHAQAPLLKVVETGFPGLPREIFIFIALFAVTNTALVNFVMGSRLLYGMAKEGLAPALLAHVHPRRHTPDYAIWVVFVAALALALGGSLTLLAQSTSLLLLSVFLVINISLAVLKLRPGNPPPRFGVPAAIPWLGASSCVVLILFADPKAYVTVLALAALALVLYRSLSIACRIRN